MNLPLQKWYKRIIPFLLIFCLLCNQLTASPDCPIVAASFSGLSEGTTVNNSSTGWYLNATNVSSSAIFWVKSNRFHAQELGGEGVWYSKVFSVAGYTDFQIATKITAEGDMNSSEYVKVYYKINGGAEILLDQRTGNFGTVDFVSPLLNGSNVQFVIRIYNYNNGGSQTSKYYIEDYRVFKEHGPCAGGIPVAVSAGNNGVLTCASPSLTLGASSTASGVTYSWTGPNSFTSTAQNPVITVAGTYNVVATNSSGSGSASITVTQNKALPGVTATGASLGCASSVTISATSPVANAQYAWTGPGFSSVLQNSVVTTAGTYTVTVTNPANGCTSSQQVQVTTGSVAASTFWLEEFTFANGTVTDTGTTPWTLENSAAGTFSVQSNELMASFSAANEGVWKSEAINITSKSNVVFSLHLRSGTAGSSDFFEDEDYIRVYYKLNGGAETLLFSDISGLKGTNTGTARDTIISPALNGSSLQIIVRLKNSSTTERYYLDNVKLTGYNTGTAPLSATVTGVATCTGTAQLNATSTSAVASWSWTGPNSFTSTLQNPTVSAGGQYIVTANFTDGCSASVPVTVTENKTAPGITASGGSLVCFTSITINASSPLATAQYSWSGPNSFTSTLKNPSVTAAGTYTATATNPANGCISVQAVQVTPAYGVAGNLWVEDFTLANGTTSDAGSTSWSIQAPSGAAASVNSNQFRVSNTGGTGEVVWTSGSINIANKTNVGIAVGIKSAVAEGGVMNETGSLTDYLRFYYKLDNGAEILFCQKLGAVNNHSTVPTVVSVGSLAGTNLRIIIRARATGSDEFYYFDNVTVAGADPGTLNAVASANGSINCASNTVTLTGSSATPGVTYSWTGPGGFTSAVQNPAVSAAGIYTLTVTDPSTGCTASDTALVSTSIVAADLWKEVFPTNGISVDNDATPWSITAPSGAVASVNSNQFRVSNTGGTGEVVWTSGSINITNKTNVGIAAEIKSAVVEGGVMNETGSLTDYLRFYYKLNNGAETLFYQKLGAVNNHSTVPTIVSVGSLAGTNLQIVIRARATGSDEFYYFDNVTVSGADQSNINASASVSDTLTCSKTSVTVLGNSTTVGVTYSWTGPNGFTAATQNATVTTPGVYTVAVSNGTCSSTATVTVYQKKTLPAGIAITRTSGTDTLTCAVNHVDLVASSSTPGATYSWTGPNGYIAANPGITAFYAGRYKVTVTNPVSGCIDTAAYTVYENRVFPGAHVDPDIAMLTCYTPSKLITASADAATVRYSWTGPGGITATGSTILATAPGNYYLVVTDTINACTTSATSTIMEDRAIPATPVITAPAGASMITCTNNSVTLTGSSSFAGLNYSWSGPGGFQASTPVIQAATQGAYTLTVSYTGNGCFATKSYTVLQNKTAPAAVTINPVPANAQMTCIISSVTLNSSTAASGVTYNWSGPNGFSSVVPNPLVNATGAYIVTITDPANGCTAADTAIVTRNNTPPEGVSALISDRLTCFVSVVTITGFSITPGATYSWTGPNGFTSNAISAQVTVGGTYQLKVTNPVNGCIQSIPANVMQNITPPNITVANTGPLTCSVFDVEIQGSSSTPNVDYNWSGPDGFLSSLPVEMVFTPGDYILTVLDLNNGCTAKDTTTVELDLTSCDVSRPGNIKTGTVTPEATAAQSGIPAAVTQFQYRAYPNPFSDQAYVEFKTPEMTPVNVSIYNTVGACKKVLFNSTAQAGQLYKLPLDATTLPAGVYYCVIRVKEKIHTIKVIALKK